MEKAVLFLLSLLLISSLNVLRAQKSGEDPPLPSTFQSMAEMALSAGQMDEAAAYFAEALALDSLYLPAMRGKGMVYEWRSRFDSALIFYERIVQLRPRFSRRLYYELGAVCYRTGQYELALTYFEEYRRLRPLPLTDFVQASLLDRNIEKEYDKKLDNSIFQCMAASQLQAFRNVGEVRNLGDSVNTKGDEYFPFLSNDRKLLLFTSRETEMTDEDLYFSLANKDEWQTGRPTGGSFNSPKNEGMATFTRDGATAFFTACQRITKGCDLLTARARRDTLTDIRRAAGWINSEEWESQASVSCDGQYLYFASDRAGGIGSADIWMSKRLPDGGWEEAKNLGEPVNTPFDEEAPFITNDGQTLFFSSTGHLGLGEQDLFMSKWNEEKGKWGPPINLGPPVNSPYRELGLFISADNKQALFASNRPGGNGRMDIYEFFLPTTFSVKPMTFVEGWVSDSLTGAPISTVILTDQRGPVMSDEEGRFFLCLPSEKNLTVSIAVDGYLPYENHSLIPSWGNERFYPLRLFLQPLAAELPVVDRPGVETFEIFFAFDRWDLPESALSALREFASEIEGTEIEEITITGYADYLGTDEYNGVLSVRRAETVRSFLEKYLGRNVIFRVSGAGESGTYTERSRNRRVEIRVSY